jgi:Zn-finger nucleic acid-binding protein
MRLVPRRDYFACDYCTTFQFPSAQSAGKDRIILTGPAKGACPVCKVPLSGAAAEAARFQACPACRGALLTNDDFGELVRIRRKMRSTPPHEPQPLDPAELERRLHCPACGHAMDTHPYYGPGAVVVDTCARCHLIWVDHGELFVIEHAPGSVTQ